MMLTRVLPALALSLAFTVPVFAQDAPAQDNPPPPPPPQQDQPPQDRSLDQTFTQNEVVQAASGFFGTTTEAVAKAVQKVFSDQGLPDAYIKGDEGSGAVVVACATDRAG